MKHRSTHIFILLAAVMVAAPQVSQELSALKNAAGRHVKAAIINAFLDLQAGAATRPAPPVADSRLAAQVRADEAAGAKKTAAAASRPATQVEVHARREVPAEAPAEVAMITDPTFELAAALPVPPAPAAFNLDPHDAQAVRGRELAMIIPPDADVTGPRPAAARAVAAEARKVAARRKKAEQLKHEAASAVWSFGDEIEIDGESEAEVRAQLQALSLLGVNLRQIAPRAPAKVVKVKRAARPAAAPAPPPRAACPTRQVACGPSIPEALYVSE